MIKPIFGCEAYVAGPKGRKDRTERKSSHLVLLAKDEEGYKNLSYMISMSYMEGFYYKPRIDQELLKKHSKGIYGLSACLGGVVNKKYLQEGESAAAETAKEYARLFEPEHFFLELQDNGLDAQYRANENLLNISELANIPVVCTADSHYLKPEHSDAHEILMCIGQGYSLDEFRQKHYKHSDKLYVRSPAEMWSYFDRIAPQAVENTQRIAKNCNVKLDLESRYLPNFGVPEGFSRETYLEKLALEGLKRRISEAPYAIDEAQYKQRLEYELGVINKMGFAGYFLIVWDFIRFAKESGVPVGPGRGSGAGSIVAWGLRITDLDPIPYDLIFERFLNPERVSMPDFDIDFCMDRRGDVIDYVSNRYGSDNVGQIVTYSALSAKSVIKDVGRVMGLPFGEVNELTKLIPNLINGRKVSIKQALELEPRLRDIQNEKPVYKRVIEIGRQLEGLNRQTGMHAAGIVIGDRPIWDYVPVCRGKEGEIVTQFAKDEVELAGLIKFDFLGLKTLTVIANAVRHVRKRRDTGPLGPNSEFDIERADLMDPAVYKLIAQADTDGVFQLESSGFKELLKRLKPDCFEDIVAAVALYRPGPLDAGMVDDYIDRKHGRKKIRYPHPVCEAILKPTYGVIVYQEQVMRIAVDLCGFSMGQADVLRKAMGKKQADVMAKMRQRFIDGAHEGNGMAVADADALFAQIEKFAGYAFNKSHSAAYAVISYQTALLKRYYPVEFMAALLSTEMGTQDNVVKYIQSAKESGMKILPPDVERSARLFCRRDRGWPTLHSFWTWRGQGAGRCGHRCDFGRTCKGHLWVALWFL
ncbi:MAG: DNA polymerase III subunit alpha [Myxococcota bacterium]